MSGRHTSGPWQSHDDYTTEGFVTIIGNVDAEIGHDGTSYSYDVVAVCEDQFGERLPNVAANVRLITAAPDLLAAAKTALETLAARKDDDLVWAAMSQLMRAITKAEGGAA